MSRATIVKLITVREVTDRLRNKVYILGTLFFAVVLVGGIAVPGLLSDDGPERFDLGLVGPVPDSFEDVLAANAAELEIEVDVVELADRDAATAAVTDGEVDAALVGDSELMAQGSPHFLLRSALETTVQQARTADELEAAGLSEEEIAAVLAPSEPLDVVDPAGQEETDLFGGEAIAFAATILLFLAVTTNASSLLSGAVEEKSSRVVEVLLGSVRPWQLLAGKIIALTGLALVQVGVLVGAALGANAVGGTFALPPATAATVLTGLAMLLIGFVFYAALYTVAGSLASTSEDAQGSAGPLSFLIMGAYFIVIFVVLPAPQGLWAQLLTYLPPTAPFAVPARVALGAIPAWQVALACGVTLLGVALTVALAARLYAASLLAGGKLTWRQAWQAEPIR